MSLKTKLNKQRITGYNMRFIEIPPNSLYEDYEIFQKHIDGAINKYQANKRKIEAGCYITSSASVPLLTQKPPSAFSKINDYHYIIPKKQI